MKENTTENGATFAKVQGILNSAVGAWEQQRGRPPNLTVHGTNFAWETREQLLASTARGHHLIQPDLIGAADASGANLVQALTNGIPPFVCRMPAGGPFLSDEDIGVIQAWIEAGAPE